MVKKNDKFIKSKKNDKFKTRKKNKIETEKKNENVKVENNKKYKKEFLYFDNNGTTLICPKAEKIMIKWLRCYNPSSNTKVSNDAKKILNSARNYIHKHCDTGGSENYVVLFTW